MKVKANYLNDRCTPLNSNSKIPETQSYVTNIKPSSVKFENKDISNIIRSIDVNKAHSHDNISIRMLKIYDSAIVESLTIIFNSCINQSMFLDIWKNSNICPIHKKGDKQTINNYWPVSLLPVCGKIFHRLIFNSLYKHLEDNKLLSVHQSGFQSSDSCVNQLLSIAHISYKVFDA